MFRKVCKIGFVLSALFVIGGCVVDGTESGANASVNPQTDAVEVRDSDASSETAMGLIFNMGPIDDRLNYEGGDKKDWRYMIVTEPGTVSIKIRLDTPANIMGGWNIFDSKNRTMYSQRFDPGVGYYSSDDLNVQRGVYYFEVYADSGKSIYTVEAIYKPGIAMVQAPPEPVDDCRGQYCDECDGAGCKRRPSDPGPTKPCKGKPCSECNGKGCIKDGGGGGGTPPPPSCKGKPCSECNGPGCKEPEGNKVKGFIAVITEKPDGSAEITIRDVGKNKGVQTGMVGYIEGTKIKIETTQCFPTSCRALIPASANPKSFKKGANVVFTVK